MTRTTPTTPYQVNLKSVDANIQGTGTYTVSKCEQFPHSVSHAPIMGMDREEGWTLPALADLFGITTEEAHACLGATAKRISDLIEASPPTGPLLAENRTGKGP